jgi:Transposase DDE domain
MSKDKDLGFRRSPRPEQSDQGAPDQPAKVAHRQRVSLDSRSRSAVLSLRYEQEIAITQTMVERVERRFDLRPEQLAGDTVYGVARLLKWLVDRKITPHVPVWDKSARHDDTFSRADFVFDQERNVYICPGGAELTSTGRIDQGHIVYYRANKHDCSACPLKPRCTTAAMRKVTRDVDEEVRDRVRALANTKPFSSHAASARRSRCGLLI